MTPRHVQRGIFLLSLAMRKGVIQGLLSSCLRSILHKAHPISLLLSIPPCYYSGKDYMVIMDLQLWSTNVSKNSRGAEEDKRGCLMKRFLVSDLSHI